MPKFISYSTGQVSDSIPHILNLAESCVFDKQSLLPALCPCKVIITLQDPLSRSYEVILPSSFNIIILTTLVYSTNPPVYSLGYGHCYKDSNSNKACFQTAYHTYKRIQYNIVQKYAVDAL